MNKLTVFCSYSLLLLILLGCSSNSVSGEFTLTAIDRDTYTAEVSPGQYDLEAEEFDTDGGGDIILTVGSGSATFYTLYPPNGAKAIYFGTEAPSVDDCQSALTETLGGSVPQVASGGYICLLTTEANIASLLIEDPDPEFPAQMTLSYTLWFVDNE